MKQTQTCKCGSEEYHIRFNFAIGATEAWAECAACGRPTATFGAPGREKLREWRGDFIDQ